VLKYILRRRVLRPTVQYRTGAEGVSTFHGEFLREFNNQGIPAGLLRFLRSLSVF
jgi:hypothetical protein